MSRALPAICPAVLLLSLPALALAESVEPPAPPAEEPAREVQFRREGFAVGVGMGPVFFFGREGLNDARGGGGGLSVRAGTSAGEKLLWFLQADMVSEDETRGSFVLSVAGHYYLREALWVRGGVGLASFVRRADPDSGQEDDVQGSLSLSGGVGVDVFRRGIFAVDLELSLSGARYEEGKLAFGGLQLAANWY